MSKQKPGTVREPNLSSREEMDRLYEKKIKDREREERRQMKKEKTARRDAFVRSGVKAGLKPKQVLWLMKIFAFKRHEHWDGRIGP